jgi:hypothetical protein
MHLSSVLSVSLSLSLLSLPPVVSSTHYTAMVNAHLQLPLNESEGLSAVSAAGDVACAVTTETLYVLSVGSGQSPTLTLVNSYPLVGSGVQAAAVPLPDESTPSCGVVVGVSTASGAALASLAYQVNGAAVDTVDVTGLACAGSLDARLDVHGAEQGTALVAAVGLGCSIQVPLKVDASSSAFGTPVAHSYANDFGVSSDFGARQSCFSKNRLFYLFSNTAFGQAGGIASYLLSADGRYGATPHAFAVTEIQPGLCAGGYSASASEAAFTYFDNHVDGNETFWANPTSKSSTSFHFLVNFPTSVLLKDGSFYDVDAQEEPIALAAYYDDPGSQYKVVLAGLRGSGMVSDVLSFPPAVSSKSGKVLGGGGGVVQANGPTNGAYVIGTTDFSFPKQNAVLYLVQTVAQGASKAPPLPSANSTLIHGKRSTCDPTTNPPVPAHCSACPPGISSICGPMLACASSGSCCYNSADAAYCCSQAPSGFPSCAA